jgi:hypothetical protein
LKSFLLRNDLSEPTFYEAEGRAFKMGRRLDGGSRRPTFEIQSEFFRKEPTEMDFANRRRWRSPRPHPRRALQSPFYIRKKAAANKEKKRKTQKFVPMKYRDRSDRS